MEIGNWIIEKNEEIDPEYPWRAEHNVWGGEGFATRAEAVAHAREANKAEKEEAREEAEAEEAESIRDEIKDIIDGMTLADLKRLLKKVK